MNMIQDSWFDRVLNQTESKLGIVITIIDSQMLFHSPAGQQLLSREHQNHKQIPACRAGFTPQCVEFCRHEMNATCRDRQHAFAKHCWKGLTEIVVPLRRHDHHWGMLYAGIWQTPDHLLHDDLSGLSSEVLALRAALPVWEDAILLSCGTMLEAVAEGLISRLDAMHALIYADNERAHKIRSFIREHAGSPDLRLADLSLELQLSESHTGRVVHELCGMTFQQLVVKERMRRAQSLLITTNLTLHAIAEQVGYRNGYQLSKAFRQLMGVPPGQFRRTGQPV